LAPVNSSPSPSDQRRSRIGPSPQYSERRYRQPPRTCEMHRPSYIIRMKSEYVEQDLASAERTIDQDPALPSYTARYTCPRGPMTLTPTVPAARSTLNRSGIHRHAQSAYLLCP